MTNARSKTVSEDQLIPLVADELAVVTGGLLAWEARPAMSSVPTGFGAWENALKAKKLL